MLIRSSNFLWQNLEDGAEDLQAEELEQQTASDRAVLKLFQDALKTNRLQRAQELAACLHLQRSLEGALKLTNLHRYCTWRHTCMRCMPCFYTPALRASINREHLSVILLF